MQACSRDPDLAFAVQLPSKERIRGRAGSLGQSISPRQATDGLDLPAVCRNHVL
jgi:hypothetical protein